MGDYPPGFRFHPTDEELVNYYLSRKVANKVIHGNIIAEVDLYKCEPWDVPEKSALKENEWYFFSPRDRKYPNGSRTNRATNRGYWKATGKDRVVLASPKGAQAGLKKTLVFYQGRAPKGERTDWIMHEYRLEKANGEVSPGQDAFVLCRVFNKKGDPNDKGPAAGLPSTTRPLGPKCEEGNIPPMEAEVEVDKSSCGMGTYSVEAVGVPNTSGSNMVGASDNSGDEGSGEVDDRDRIIWKSEDSPEVCTGEIPYLSFTNEEMLFDDVPATLTLSSSDDWTWPLASGAPDAADDISESSHFPVYNMDVTGCQNDGGFGVGDGLQAASYGKADCDNSEFAYIQEFLSSDSYDNTELSPEVLQAMLDGTDVGIESTEPLFSKLEPFGYGGNPPEIRNGVFGVSDAEASEDSKPCIVIRSRPSREKIDSVPTDRRIRMSIRVPKQVVSNIDQVHLGGGVQGSVADVRDSVRCRNAIKEEPDSDRDAIGLGKSLYEASVAREVILQAFIGNIQRDSSLVMRENRCKNRKLVNGQGFGGNLSPGKINTGGEKMGSLSQDSCKNSESVTHLSSSSTEVSKLGLLPVGLTQLLSTLPGLRKLTVPTNSIPNLDADVDSGSESSDRKGVERRALFDTNNGGSNDRSMPESEKESSNVIGTDDSMFLRSGAPQRTVKQWRDNSSRICSVGRKSLRTRVIQLIGGTAACLSLFVGFISMVRLGVALIC